jgi:hypothetical protein
VGPVIAVLSWSAKGWSEGGDQQAQMLTTMLSTGQEC